LSCAFKGNGPMTIAFIATATNQAARHRERNRIKHFTIRLCSKFLPE
jgi:hypothetical protein